MTRPLFERYKEALRMGHLAARAGKIDAALAAYAEAARIAPDRAAPHTSSATALHGAGRDPEAFASFERALAIAPDDEATLRARALVFEDIGRAASAAADLERLAEALDRGGRRADALVAARRAVGLTATPARRRLVARLEAPEADRPTPAPAQRATPALPPAPQPEAPPRAAKPSSGRGTTTSPAARPATKRETPAPRRPRPAAPPPAARPKASPDQEAAPQREAAPERETPPARVAAPAETPAIEAAPKPAAHQSVVAPTATHAESPAAASPAETPAVPSAELPAEAPVQPSVPWPAVDLPSPPPAMPVGPPPNVDTLMADAGALIDAGDLVAARNLMLTAVAVHRAAGRPDAALDVCLQLLALAPGDAYVHLAIAGLQLDRGWQALATEKIELLLRLTALTGDTQAEADVHALAAERVRDEPRTSVGTQ